jgi:hypothetical protein
MAYMEAKNGSRLAGAPFSATKNEGSILIPERS